MSTPNALASITSLWDAPKVVVIAVLVLATLLPVVALVAAFDAQRSSERERRRVAPPLALIALVLSYLHPVSQEFLNELYLAPKLERARALAGESVEQLYADLGEPSFVMHDSSPSPQSYSYLLYRPAPWTPLAAQELVVPISDDGKRVSIIAHFSD